MMNDVVEEWEKARQQFWDYADGRYAPALTRAGDSLKLEVLRLRDLLREALDTPSSLESPERK